MLEAAGYSVQITGQPVCCGLTWISTGQLDGARRQLRRSLRRAGPGAAARASRSSGWNRPAPPCCAARSPSCCPTTRAPARSGAATRTLAELLAATPGWAPPDLTGVRARGPAALPPARRHGLAGRRRAAGQRRRQVDAVGGCCGLAGNFGVERGHYDVSVAVAETALLPAVRDAAAGAVVLADGFSCRTQLDQLAVASTHLAQLLASRLRD